MRLRAGDEAAFADLVERYHPAMIRLALLHVRSRAVAEEVAQDAWVGLLRGLDGFEGRSSLRTWLFRIVVNRAISTGIREHSHVPVGDDELELSDGRFSQDGWWVTPPTHWADDVLDRMTAPALVVRVREAITQLPPLQRSVVTLRDVDGLSAEEVCSVLNITAVHQRVQLHRARTRIRADTTSPASKRWRWSPPTSTANSRAPTGNGSRCTSVSATTAPSTCAKSR
jgi:RNA polymerase sigma-70 factor (ECF subfamily)